MLFKTVSSKLVFPVAALLLVCSYFWVIGREQKQEVAQPKTSENVLEEDVPASVVDALQTLVEFQNQSISAEKGRTKRELEVGKNIFATYQYTPVSYGKYEHNYDQAPSETLKSLQKITTISPTEVLSTDKTTELTVYGDGFRPEMKVYAEGRQLTTNFLNNSSLQAFLPPFSVTADRVIRLEVRDLENRAVSNSIVLKVATFPLDYVGRIAEQDGSNLKAILVSGNERFSVSVGDTVKGRWKLLAINTDSLEIEDLQSGRKERLFRGSSRATEREAQKEKNEQKEKSEKSVEESADNSSTKEEASSELFSKPSKTMTYQELLEYRRKRKGQK